MNKKIAKSAEAISLFCRLNLNAKKNISIRSGEMGLLILMVKNNTPVTPLMAADFFKVSKPMIATMVKSLISKGYIMKKADVSDKRSYTMIPTVQAIELVNSCYEEYYNTINILIDNMGENEFFEMVSLINKANLVLIEKSKNE